MSDKFSTISINRLFHLTFLNKNSIFGIPKELFFIPKDNDPFKTERFGITLESPLGVAAGPQTQMAQNIIAAWLCGARYIELKTIQTLDELEISKPCIDMQDEGYNCEWSQELKINQSYDEYLNAWIIIHILRDHFGWKKDVGTVFNMSVGYNMEGILKDNVQWFFSKMKNCREEKLQKIEALRPLYPNIDKIDIPDCISDNITLSTMHGCPPDEIEKIGLYLIGEKKLNTVVKLNPTLLGKDELRKILNHYLEYGITVPDIAFEHDLKYPDSLNIIKSLQKCSVDNKVFFGLKLTNTLEVINNKNIFDKKEQMMYMSGKALHPISINVVRKLQNEFNGTLDISFSAGADCFNIADILSCGLKPVTVSSDLLKPGGYTRLNQYIEEINNAFKTSNASSIDNYILNGKPVSELQAKTLSNLNEYASGIIHNEYYKETFFLKPDIKTQRELKTFDCVHAPCVDTCPTHQDIPEYMYWVSKGNIENAYKVILRTNPFPSVLGMVCDHTCQTKCTRINYDNNLLIREVKRFVTENAAKSPGLLQNPKNGMKATIIGAGPSGLSCAYFLALAGFETEVFENKGKPGGMVADAIPSFRLTKEAITNDVARIENLGVKIHYNSKVNASKFDEIRQKSEYIYIAVGAQKAKTLNIEGNDAHGVLDPLLFLAEVKNCAPRQFGKNIVIIGGGNTAMDVARTAHRLVGKDGNVTIVYRRTIKEMPADSEEIKAVMEEGIKIIELIAPEKVEIKDNKVAGLVCSKMELSGKDESGRPKPVKINGSEFTIECDTIIPALGQNLDVDFTDPKLLKADKYFETQIPNVFIGGDAYRGAATIIKAVADGRLAAENIIGKAQRQKAVSGFTTVKETTTTELMIKKSKRSFGSKVQETSLGNRKNFDIVISSLNKEHAITEASRCLMCDEVCSICETVCPNRANYTYITKPVEFLLKKAEKQNDEIVISNDKKFVIEQKTQVLNIADFCNECGNCATFCPTSGRPYADKPRFCLTVKSFKENDNCYTITRRNGKTNIMYKEKNNVKTLTLDGNKYIYDSEFVQAEFDVNSFDLLNVKFNGLCVKEAHFQKAAEMSVLLHAAKDLYVTDLVE